MLSGGAALVGVAAHRADALGGEHDLVAGLALHPVADEFLGGADVGRADRVDIGGVDEVDAAVEGGGHDVVRFGFFGLEAEGHGAKADFGDAESGASHAAVPSCGVVSCSSLG